MIGECPQCGKKEQWEIGLISTTNEWRWHCESCDIRFNDTGSIYIPELWDDKANRNDQ